MSKPKVRTEDVDLELASVGDEIVLDDGVIATITNVVAKEVEVKTVKKVIYLEYSAPDKRGRTQLWSSVHTGEEQVEVVVKPTSIVDKVSGFFSRFRKPT